MAHLGLFAAADGDRLEVVLASMPLRVWRTDEVTPLSPHPNDPPPTPTSSAVTATEFLVTFTLAVPPGTGGQTVEDTKAREAQAAHGLAAQGHLLRLWTLPDRRALGLYQARDAAQMQAILEALPLAPWMTMDTTPLSPHPSDPANMYPPNTAATGTPQRGRDPSITHVDDQSAAGISAARPCERSRSG